MEKIINYENIKLEYDIKKVFNKLKKIYKDITIEYCFYPEYFLEVWFTKDKYIRGERITILDLKSFDLENLFKFKLNNFCYEVYEKIEKEIEEE